MEIVYDLLEFIQANGWFIVLGGCLLYYLYNKYNIRIPEFSMPQSNHRDLDEDQQLKRMQNIEAVRLKQQAAMDAAAAKYREEKIRKDELLSKQKEEEWELHQQGLGYKSKTKRTEDDLSSFGLAQKNPNSSRPKLRGADYNPLTGQSSSDAQRPTFKRAQPRRGG